MKGHYIGIGLLIFFVALAWNIIQFSNKAKDITVWVPVTNLRYYLGSTQKATLLGPRVFMTCKECQQSFTNTSVMGYTDWQDCKGGVFRELVLSLTSDSTVIQFCFKATGRQEW